MKQIASRLGVSVGSVHLWTSDIEIGEEARARNLRQGRASGAKRWADTCRRRRLAFQDEGRRQARRQEPLHVAGCMLYWAEGAKSRGELSFVNSDRGMMSLFWRFLTRYFEIDPHRVAVRLNVYLNNGLSLDQVVDWWRVAVPVPRASFKNHVTNHYPTSSSGRKRHKLPYGVCTVRLHDTRTVQHIYGAIQEYAGFEEPRWLDGPPRKQRPRK